MLQSRVGGSRRGDRPPRTRQRLGHGWLGDLFGTNRQRAAARSSTSPAGGARCDAHRDQPRRRAGRGQHRQIDRRLDGRLDRPRHRARHARQHPAALSHPACMSRAAPGAVDGRHQSSDAFPLTPCAALIAAIKANLPIVRVGKDIGRNCPTHEAFPLRRRRSLAAQSLAWAPTLAWALWWRRPCCAATAFGSAPAAADPFGSASAGPPCRRI